MYLDEALSFLLEALHASESTITQDVSIPLCTVIPVLASAHPSPATRHQAYRILSRIISLSDPTLRLQVLKQLCSDPQFPQMRVAAVGLVKDSVLAALSSDAPSMLASPALLQGLGKTLFRPDPPDFCSKFTSLKELKESSEPPRLVECLSLLYILLQRDIKNRTGIWDKDNLRNLEKQLLSPVRTLVENMLEAAQVRNGEQASSNVIITHCSRSCA